MAPNLKKISQQFDGRVDLWKINADEEPELVRSLGVLGIPTMIAFNGGGEVFRRTGAQSLENLIAIFAAAETNTRAAVQVAPFDRLLRLLSGAVIFILGFYNGPSALLMILGGLVAFTGVYDRCPVYQAIAPRVKAFFSARLQGTRQE